MTKYLKNPFTGHIVKAEENVSMSYTTTEPTYSWKKSDGTTQIVDLQTSMDLFNAGEVVTKLVSGTPISAIEVTETDYMRTLSGG